jgi:hypothetical protein
MVSYNHPFFWISHTCEQELSVVCVEQVIMRICFYGLDPYTMLISGYVYDFVMYITSTEKQVRSVFVCEIVFMKAGMYITFVFL